MSSQGLFFSLVLATVGRSEEVGRCLRSLALQCDKDFEVIIVDQNGDARLDKWVEEAISLGINLKHFKVAMQGLSSARNFGINKSSGQIIGFPDDDCWYEPTVIAELRLSFSRDVELSGLIACWVEQSAARANTRHNGLLSLNEWRRFRGGDASSITLFLRRPIFDSGIEFDERLGVGNWFGSAEETDVILTALANGEKISYCPQARVHHSFGLKQEGNLKRRWKSARMRARGTGAIYAKHRMSMGTILRGLLAPALKTVWDFRKGSAFLGFAVSIGRFEGLIEWRRRNG